MKKLGCSIPKQGLVASLLVLVIALVALACAKAEPTPTPVPTPTATPIPAATPTPTATPIPAATPTPTATPRPAPTATPTPTPAPRIRTRAGITQWVNQNAKKGGVLRVANQFEITHTDMNMSLASGGVTQIFGPRTDGLLRDVGPDPSKSEGSLAKSWNISADGKVVTFVLQENVKWHDGTPFSADDVKATLDRIINPPATVVSPRAAWFEPVSSVDVVDPLTVRLTLKAPYPGLFPYLSNGFMGIMQKKALERHKGDLIGVPDWPGTGPFKHVKNEANVDWFATRNPEYWNGDLPLLDGMEWHAIAPANISAVLLAQRIDLFRLTLAVGRDVNKQDSRIKIRAYSSPAPWVFEMNKTKPPFNDVRVRQAINMVWDQVAMRQGFESVRGIDSSVESSHWVPIGSAWAKDILGADYLDPKAQWKQREGGFVINDAVVSRARQLMTEAGYGNGLGTVEVDIRRALSPANLILPQTLEASINKYLPGSTKFAYRLVSTAESYDNLVKVTYRTWLNAVFTGEVDHPLQWLANQYDSRSASNLAHYKSPRFDALMDQMKVAADRARVAELVRQAIAVLEEEVPVIQTGLLPVLIDAWWDYAKDHGCETIILEMSQCNKYDTAWLDK